MNNTLKDKLILAGGAFLITIGLVLALFQWQAKAPMGYLGIAIEAVLVACGLLILFQNTDFIKNRRLIKNGYVVPATATYISRESATNMGQPLADALQPELHQRFYFRIHCEGIDPQTDSGLKFVSQKFLEKQPDLDPSQKPMLNVYVSRKNPNDYYVDTRNINFISTAQGIIGGKRPIGYFISYDGKNFIPEQEQKN
jgi:hypothetical protein